MGSELSINTKRESQNPPPIQVFFGSKGFGKRDAALKLIASKDKNGYLFLNANELEDVSLIQQSRIDSFERLLFNLEILVIEDAFLIPSCTKIIQEIQHSKPSLELILIASSIPEVLHCKKIDSEFRFYTFFPNSRTSKNQSLLMGALPSVINADSDESRKIILATWIDDFYVKVNNQFKTSQAKQLKRLLLYLAKCLLQEFSLETLAKNLKISENSILNYIHFCNNHFMLFPIHQTLLKHKEKIAFGFCDLGIRNYLLNPESPFLPPTDTSILLQNQQAADVYFINLSSVILWSSDRL
jgi:hypothetical protein